MTSPCPQLTIGIGHRSLRGMKSKRPRRKWSTEEKREIAETVQRRQRAGERFSHICRDLDILDGTLRLWIQQYPAAQLLPVKTAELSTEASESAAPGTISLFMPSGIRFEGLDVGDVAALLEDLR